MPVVVGTGFSASSDVVTGVDGAAREALDGLGGAPCDVAVVFVAGELVTQPEAVLGRVRGVLDPGELVGATAGGLVAGGREYEQGEGVVVWAISLGEDAAAEVFELHTTEVEGGLALSGIPAVEIGTTSAVLLLADTSRLPIEPTLQAFEEHLPGVPIVGGVPSLVPPDGRPLLRDVGPSEAAALGVRFEGVEVLPLVSQGARPIGPELAVTAGEGGIIHQLAGRPAIDALRDAIDGLTGEDREQIRHGLLLGLVVQTGQPEYGSGDFVVRGLAGADPETGAVAIGAPVTVGQIARLHVRDPASATAELEEALRIRRAATGSGDIAGALAFTCNGRGQDMFGVEDHDAAIIQRELGPLPLAGMIAAGEIGPVGGHAFAHGFTATLAVFLA
ncbi:FIST N-terminal domain-containing protein [Patulibacter sp. SYSU D01012]|uniref:FIST signal transduction protein n=1 Tax=Patulibacter sp. SYSU D01012 TaxID=2817381 RepID=UPI001B30AF61|nr:FIST N-terminal domain-containing protein [Patulibacter sp. SYSU D01012]